MARRSGSRPRPRPAVPFVLASPPRRGGPDRPAAAEVALAGLCARRQALAEKLTRLDAACWRGLLDGRRLVRLQRLRVRFAALEGEIARREYRAERAGR